MAKVLYWILPNLAPFDVRSQVVHGQAVTLGYMALTSGYGLLYGGALVVAAMLVFSKARLQVDDVLAPAHRRRSSWRSSRCSLRAAGLQWIRESRYPQPIVSAPSLYLTSGTTARRLTTGYNALAADLYWIRAIQYFGDLKLKAARAAGPAPPSRRPAIATNSCIRCST